MNVLVGSKVFRDVEKMNLSQLTEVARAIKQRMLDLMAKGKNLAGSKGGSCNVKPDGW